MIAQDTMRFEAIFEVPVLFAMEESIDGEWPIISDALSKRFDSAISVQPTRSHGDGSSLILSSIGTIEADFSNVAIETIEAFEEKLLSGEKMVFIMGGVGSDRRDIRVIGEAIDLVLRLSVFCRTRKLASDAVFLVITDRDMASHRADMLRM